MLEVEELKVTRRPLIQLHVCLDLIRSVTLFVTVTRILAFLALIILISANKTILNDLLSISEEEEAFSKKIPNIFTTIVNGFLISATIIDIIGITGYARLSPALLNLYATCLFVELALLGFIGITSSYSDLNNHRWIHFFEIYKQSHQARTSVNNLQLTFKCCGTQYYSFEDMAVLPASCCADENLLDGWICLKENAYTKQCPTTQANIKTALENAGVTQYLPAVAGALILLTVGMGTITFFVAHRMAAKNDD